MSQRKERKDKGRSREYYSSKNRTRRKWKKCISLDKDLWIEIDMKARERVQTRSEFINDIMRVTLGSTKSYIKYQLKEKSRHLNLVKFEALNYNDEQEIEAAIKKMKSEK